MEGPNAGVTVTDVLTGSMLVRRWERPVPEREAPESKMTLWGMWNELSLSRWDLTTKVFSLESEVPPEGAGGRANASEGRVLLKAWWTFVERWDPTGGVVLWRWARGDLKGRSDASGCVACQRGSDPVRGSESADGAGGNGVVNSGSVSGIDVEGEEEEDDDEDDEVS